MLLVNHKDGLIRGLNVAMVPNVVWIKVAVRRASHSPQLEFLVNNVADNGCCFSIIRDGSFGIADCFHIMDLPPMDLDSNQPNGVYFSHPSRHRLFSSSVRLIYG